MRARTGTWNTRLRHLEAVLERAEERAEELSEQGGAAVVAPVASPTRPGGPQGERREKANWVVGPRMERKGKNSAS